MQLSQGASPSGHKAKETVCSWYCSWRAQGEEMEPSRPKRSRPWGRRVNPGSPPHLSVRCSSLKMCTVSVLLEAQRNWESMLNTRELMFTYLRPSKDRTGQFMACCSRSGSALLTEDRSSHSVGPFLKEWLYCTYLVEPAEAQQQPIPTTETWALCK